MPIYSSNQFRRIQKFINYQGHYAPFIKNPVSDLTGFCSLPPRSLPINQAEAINKAAAGHNPGTEADNSFVVGAGNNLVVGVDNNPLAGVAAGNRFAADLALSIFRKPPRLCHPLPRPATRRWLHPSTGYWDWRQPLRRPLKLRPNLRRVMYKGWDLIGSWRIPRENSWSAARPLKAAGPSPVYKIAAIYAQPDPPQTFCFLL
jgi:hypothetical protein